MPPGSGSDRTQYCFLSSVTRTGTQLPSRDDRHGEEEELSNQDLREREESSPAGVKRRGQGAGMVPRGGTTSRALLEKAGSVP
ncbi:hypothetical protein NDU88_006024 [Pleurodeles waltl]|uniref:Uncharacterized protein n=1 Tax=Pleurodeles waltl TaxID=8319 RepID=A0AAV7MCX0_PLEWA|nr:hypothetical protein NDU88_006024 [Pleurodeles waltl]